MYKYRVLALGSIIGMAVGVGGFAAAQSFLGNATLVVNGQTYGGAFTPLEAPKDLYVSLQQLSQAMGFTYTWTKNQLTIDTAGYTPSTGSSNYPLQFHVTVEKSSALTVLSSALGHFQDPGHYTQFTVGFFYQGQRAQISKDRVSLAFAGMPGGALSVNESLTGGGWTYLTNSNRYNLPPSTFSGQYYARTFRVMADQPGTLQMTITDTSNTQVQPQTITLHFTY